jgi:hypothetical protein
MTITTIASIVTVALAGLVPASCQKHSAAGNTKSAATVNTSGEAGNVADQNDLNGTNCFLGDLTLTNHTETLVKIGQNKQCYFTTKMIDSRNAQITLALECKETNSKASNLAVAQIVTRSDKPFEVAIGNCSLSFTPHIVAE